MKKTRNQSKRLITLNHVGADVYNRLKRLADAEKRSLSAQALFLIEQALQSVQAK